MESVEPLRSLKQFEEYQHDPQSFMKTQAEQKEKDDLRKAAKMKAAEETSASQASTAQFHSARVIKNVMTRMECKLYSY